MEVEMRKDTFRGGLIWGMIGGLIGTIIMDIVIVGFFLLVGMPIDLIYSFIGDVAQSFFLRLGFQVAGGAPLGALFHFFLGLALGGLFGIAISQIKALRLRSVKKGILLGMLYIEVASQPILVTAPLLIPMTTPDIVQWYGLSTAMHLIYGGVLGVVLSYWQKKMGFESTAA
jgi:hypothetical protein